MLAIRHRPQRCETDDGRFSTDSKPSAERALMVIEEN
jgi:hypothetical protein